MSKLAIAGLVGADLSSAPCCGSAKTRPIAAAVLLRRAVGRVVHLEDEPRAGRNQLGHSLAKHHRPARRERWPRANRELRSPRAGPADLARRNDADDDVMHDGPIARPALGGLDPLVLGEARIDEESTDSALRPWPAR